MIRVTIWYEFLQEAGYVPKQFIPEKISEDRRAEFVRAMGQASAEIRTMYPKGMMETLADALSARDPELSVRVVTLYDEEYGLSDAVLDATDVLLWWGHLAHRAVPDALAQKVIARIQRGMGFIALHSAHRSKPFTGILGSSGTLKWRAGDRERVWTVNPAHPIAAGIPEHFELPVEEMYGEPFDVAKPDDVVFMSWFAGGEVFRSGMTWTRGYGKIFYFQPGHETNSSFYSPYVQQILVNAVHWAAPALIRPDLSCPRTEKLEK